MRNAELERRLRPFPRAASKEALSAVFFELMASIDSPRSLAAYTLFKHGEFAQLVNLEINPSDYSSSDEFANDYLATKWLSKYPNFKHPDLDPEARALASFFEYEEMCRVTNKKFTKLSEDPSQWDPLMLSIFGLAKRKISRLLGRPNLDSISDAFGWGPGATTSTRGNHTSAYVKFSSRLDVTSNCLVMGHCCVNSIPSWVNCQLQTDEYPSVEASVLREAFNTVRGNEIVFVPKNAKTHRVIAKEPHVNSYLQKGFGAEIRRKLRGAGIDLKDQSQNQRLAKLGSLNGNLATIDLSGASDTISTELVRLLLPADWFSLLDQIRSKQGFIRKTETWIHYHKFSSMGNACTFELESLVFWALCQSAIDHSGCENVLSVYGDDLIVPVDAYDLIARVIDFAGFKVNDSKSFSSGPFRESCGKDYFLGNDVRPIFLKEEISNVESVFKLANSIRRYGHRRNFGYGCDRRWRSAWLVAIHWLPEYFRDFKIPEGFGDCGIVVNFDEATPSLSNRGWWGYLFKALTRVPVKEHMRDEHAGYTALLSVTGVLALDETNSPFLKKRVNRQFGVSSPLLGRHTLRDMTRPKVARIHTHGWCDLGPWE